MAVVDLLLFDPVADDLGFRPGHADAALAHAPVEDRDGELESDDLLVEQVRVGRAELLAGLREAEAGVERGRSAPLGPGPRDV